MVPRLHGEYRAMALEILLTGIHHLDNAFVELKDKNIVGLLTHR